MDLPFRIVVLDRSTGKVWLTRQANTRAVADRLFCDELHDWPDLDVMMCIGDVPVISAGPRTVR